MMRTWTNFDLNIKIKTQKKITMQSKGSTSALIIFSAVVFFAVVNGTMVNLALPFVGRDFGVTEGTYGWISTVYALMFGIFSAINGRIGDIVGMRRLYLSFKDLNLHTVKISTAELAWLIY